VFGLITYRKAKIGYEGSETALDRDENAVLADNCRFWAHGYIVKDGRLFLTDQNWIVLVTSEGVISKRNVRDHYYHVSCVRNVRVENKQSDQPSLAIDWTYDEELTYRYDSLNDPEQWQRKILEILKTKRKHVRHDPGP